MEYKKGKLHPGHHVTPRDRCARCPPVIRCCCVVIACVSCIAYHVIMCISFCIRVRLMHPSLFPVVRFAIRRSYVIRRPLLASLCEWVLNILGMARGLPSGLGIAPVDRLSSFVPFGIRLVLQRLVNRVTVKPLSLCSPTPLPKWAKTHLTPLHALGRSITIVWAKTAPHLDSPSSLYL